MIITTKTYKTSDGVEFDNKTSATKHEKKLKCISMAEKLLGAGMSLQQALKLSKYPGKISPKFKYVSLNDTVYEYNGQLSYTYKLDGIGFPRLYNHDGNEKKRDIQIWLWYDDGPHTIDRIWLTPKKLASRMDLKTLKINHAWKLKNKK